MTSKPKLILFDWDGTLVDTLPLIRSAHEAVWATYGQGAFTETQFEAILLMDPRDVFTNVYGAQAAAAQADFYKFIDSNHINALKEFPNLLDLVEKLSQQGIAQGVVSKKTRQYLVSEIAHLGLSSYFTCVIATGDAAREKPFPDPILKALDQFPGIDKADIWYLGDAESDMAASAAAGTQSALILHGKDKSALIAKYNPPHVFRDLADVMKFI